MTEKTTSRTGYAPLERGDDTEVAAGAAQRPEQVGMVFVVGADECSVREDDLGGEDMVDG
jgi:hypothetical protein